MDEVVLPQPGETAPPHGCLRSCQVVLQQNGISRISKKEIVLEEITTYFFGNAIDCTIDEKVWLPAADIKKNSEKFKAVLTATMSVIQRQYQRYYAMEVSDDLTSKLESARTHNMDSEEVMGMFSVQVMGMFSVQVMGDV